MLPSLIATGDTPYDLLAFIAFPINCFQQHATLPTKASGLSDAFESAIEGNRLKQDELPA